jgi:HlyD family secretion protein
MKRNVRPAQAARILCGTAIVVLLGGCGGENGNIAGSGTMEAREVAVSAKTPGEIVEMAVDEGSSVEAGDLLAAVDDEDAIQQRRQAEAGVELAEAQLSMLLEGAAPQDVRQAEEAVRQAREEFELARKQFERTERMFNAGSISESEYDRARARVNQARAGLNSAEAALEKARGPARAGELRAARAKLEQARATLARALRRVEDTHITSPISGTVVTTAREEGEFVPTGAPVAEVADLSVMYVNVYVAEPRLADIKLGSEAFIAPDGTEERFKGEVVFISPRAEFTPSNVQTDEERAKLVYRVKVRAPNPDGTLKIGMPVDVTIAAGENGNADAEGN